MDIGELDDLTEFGWLPASVATREARHDLIEGRLSSPAGRSELVQLATRLIIEEALEAEVRDALGREYYERGGEANGGYHNDMRKGRLRTAEGLIDYSVPQVAGGAEPFRSELREHLKSRSEALEIKTGERRFGVGVAPPGEIGPHHIGGGVIAGVIGPEPVGEAFRPDLGRQGEGGRKP